MFKKQTITILAFLIHLLASSIIPTMAQNIQVASYNIRFDNPNDHGNLWQDRAIHLIHQIKFHKMDIIGTQEGLHHQLEEMKNSLGFPYVGVGRDEGNTKGEFTAIFFNPNKLDLIDQGTFWLSPTPEKPSKGWDAALPRICTYAKFITKGGKKFWVFNTHYDHIGQKAREESSRLVLSKISELNDEGLEIILMGDFNVNPENTAYRLVVEQSELKDSRLISELPSVANQGTFNGFKWEQLPKEIIDHIFVSPGLKVKRHGILTENYGMKYPSDHFPVMIEVGLAD